MLSRSISTSCRCSRSPRFHVRDLSPGKQDKLLLPCQGNAATSRRTCGSNRQLGARILHFMTKHLCRLAEFVDTPATCDDRQLPVVVTSRKQGR
jgi:hypothetical protein